MKQTNWACFQHDMPYGTYGNLLSRIASHKVSREKKFAVACNPKYDEYQRGLASIIYKLLNK